MTNIEDKWKSKGEKDENEKRGLKGYVRRLTFKTKTKREKKNKKEGKLKT